LLTIPETRYTADTNINNLSRFHKITYITQRFWQLWSRDYIHSLQQKSNWLKAETNVDAGQLVIIQEDNVPSREWRLGKIIATFPGRDGKIRVVDVKTRKGILRRPIHKLVPLPTPDH